MDEIYEAILGDSKNGVTEKSDFFERMKNWDYTNPNLHGELSFK